ncbi:MULTISPECIES: hypothetical protein [Bacteroidales]|jgi:hypothetical protein|nr:hypothetical protein [Parabacteroides merdae]EDN85634.1 hypothetical protein PARMER_02716 [Parabacteroides merdae ATCC 43184]EKN34368.1 hypothetical protein HMPREF1078_01388 [Parabacteroides merdae CL09T00C40]MCS2918667.1 hypothetical protein [Parabacteroides merdae]CUP43196.1 Uncharacterised protein [Parabacteroides merdae]SUV33136.1 Uncharacterised protein [Parabacteroides merdae]
MAMKSFIMVVATVFVVINGKIDGEKLALSKKKRCLNLFYR